MDHGIRGASDGLMIASVLGAASPTAVFQFGEMLSTAFCKAEAAVVGAQIWFQKLLERFPPLNTKTRTLDEMSPEELSEMSLEELQEALPEGWKYYEHGPFVYIKNELGEYRIRIDPPDAVTDYTHMHIYDSNGNLLNKLGEIVSDTSLDGHLPYSK